MDRRAILILIAMGVVGYGVVQSWRSAPGIRDDAGGRISYISQGETVDVAAHVQKQGLTIIDFGAPW